MGSGKRSENGIIELYDTKRFRDIAKKVGKKLLLRVFDSGVDFSDEYIKNIIDYLKSEGYEGITLASYTAARCAPAEYLEFLMKLKKELMGEDLLLFTEVDGNRDPFIDTVSDGVILSYEKAALKDIPSFSDGEKKLFSTFAENAEAAKTFIDIPSLAYMGDEQILVSEATGLAYSSAREIDYDEDKMISHFTFNRYQKGMREPMRVAFESLENVKAKLELVAELGYMGISFDVMKIPVNCLMLFETSFGHPPIYSDI